MKLYFTLLLLLVAGAAAHAQQLPIELMAGRENLWYQHVLAKKFSSDSRFGFFNVSTLHVYHDRQRTDEIMSQSYVTWGLSRSFYLQAGAFYASGPGFSPSVGVQFVKQLDDFFILLVPRIDIKKKGSYDAMALVRYQPRLSDQLSLYSHIQLMSNYSGNNHNRSYQNFWLGLGYKSFQFGMALNLDEYGAEYITYYNPGLFIRTAL